MAEETHYDPAKFRLEQLVSAELNVHGEPTGTGEWGGRPIHAPIALVLGHLEKLTTNELEEVRVDINAEITRRNGRPG